jgi:hypothetical protein
LRICCCVIPREQAKSAVIAVEDIDKDQDILIDKEISMPVRCLQVFVVLEDRLSVPTYYIDVILFRILHFMLV